MKPDKPRDFDPFSAIPPEVLGVGPVTTTGKFKAPQDQLHSGKIVTLSLALLALLVSLGSIFGAYRLFISDAKAQTREMVDAGLLPVHVEIRALKEEQKVLKEGQAAVMTEVREMRLDLKEMYKSSRYDRPSARLEAPLTALDGGR